MSIKPIETNYRGYRFRSRLEARWAVFFDALGTEWHYEPEGFHLEHKGVQVNYLPDFWLPELEAWGEVKGPPLTEEDRLKAALLAYNTHKPVIFFQPIPDHSLPHFEIWGDPLAGLDGAEAKVTRDECVIAPCYRCGQSYHLLYKENCDILVQCQVDDCEAMFEYQSITDIHGNITAFWGETLDLRHPLNAARRARFEHGEQG